MAKGSILEAKLVSKASAITVAEIAAETISSFQCGGMNGMHMLDHITKIEAKILEFVARRLPHAGIIALDVRAVFPSLSRFFFLGAQVYSFSSLALLFAYEFARTRTCFCMLAQ